MSSPTLRICVQGLCFSEGIVHTVCQVWEDMIIICHLFAKVGKQPLGCE